MRTTLLRTAGVIVAITLLAACANTAQEKPQAAASAMHCPMDKDMQCRRNMSDMKDRMSAMQDKMKMCRDMMAACANGGQCDMDKMMKNMGDMHGMMGTMMQQMRSMSQGPADGSGQQDDHATHQHDAPK